jgi:GMP synthase-like glutamine amidotransferase
MQQPALHKLLKRVGFLFLGIAVAVAGLVIAPRLLPKEQLLKGLIVDLELNVPDPSRYGELRDALTRKITAEDPALRNVRVETDYAHFREFYPQFRSDNQPDFVILSPQGTPWHMYRGEAAVALQAFKGTLNDWIRKRNLPVLAICGGHQFLASAFGGTVGFMDARYAEKVPERYPKDAVGEKGLTELFTLADDPILARVASHPGAFQVMESHYEEVKVLPPLFVNLARSEMSEIQLVRIPGKLVYGMAFHPERSQPDARGGETTAGTRILANFLTMVAAGR